MSLQKVANWLAVLLQVIRVFQKSPDVSSSDAVEVVSPASPTSPVESAGDRALSPLDPASSSLSRPSDKRRPRKGG